ncbi:MAG: UDP-N-acetylmuramate dehydrogenase [bacterium]
MNNSLLEKLQKSELKFEENKILAPFTTWQVGGPAKFFIEVENSEQAQKAFSIIKETESNYLILGKGSNVLIADEGFVGVAIKMSNNEISIKNREVCADAGAMYSRVGNLTVAASLQGMEFAATIPGSVGGAVRGNAGAFGTETKDHLEKVEYLDLDDKIIKIKTASKDDCKFNYRDSVFKHNKRLILKTYFKLEKGNKEESENKIKEFIAQRKAKQPYGKSCGSVFKNPEPQFAGELIEKNGLKGYCIGSACVSEQHANFILNKDKATAQDIYNLIKHIQKVILENENIKLETEVQLLGFNK